MSSITITITTTAKVVFLSFENENRNENLINFNILDSWSNKHLMIFKLGLTVFLFIKRKCP